jgi:hypothetical protein
LKTSGAVINGHRVLLIVSSGVRASRVEEADGSISFRTVRIDLAEKRGSLNPRLTWPQGFTNNFGLEVESQNHKPDADRESYVCV